MLDVLNLLYYHFFSRREAQVDVEGQFLVRIIYEDAKTYDLVAAASKVLSKFIYFLFMFFIVVVLEGWR